MSKASHGITSQRGQSISFLSIDCMYILYTVYTKYICLTFPSVILFQIASLILSNLCFCQLILPSVNSYHLILPSCSIIVQPSQLGLGRQAGTIYIYIHTPYALLPTLSATIPTIRLEAVGFMPSLTPLIAGIEIHFGMGRRGKHFQNLLR